MQVGILLETFPEERRVALTPQVVPTLTEAGHAVLVSSGAGLPAGFEDAAYAGRGARLVASRADVLEGADIVPRVRVGAVGVEPDESPSSSPSDADLMRPGQIVIGLADPFREREALERLAGAGVVLYALELLPRISRAQTMDALSSMATVAGYKAVLLAAERLTRMFPMMVTAAGTMAPARVFVLGAGVAGLSAIATARRLGARVKAYDVRAEAREEIASLGAEPVTIELGRTAGDVRDDGGYAKRLGDEVYRSQQEALVNTVSQSDVVIATAAVPGAPAPRLVTRVMVERMPRGAVVVDLAAASGGNCELTEPGRSVSHGGVTILGPTNLPSTVPYHASEMYARNVTQFMLHLLGRLAENVAADDPTGGDDEILRETLLAASGRIVHPRVLEAWAKGG